MDYKSDNTEFETWAKSEQFDLQRALVWGVWTYYDPRTAAAWLAWTHLKGGERFEWIDYSKESPPESDYYDVKWKNCEGSVPVYYSSYADEWLTAGDEQPIAWKHWL